MQCEIWVPILARGLVIQYLVAFACAPFWRSGAPEDVRAFHQVALKSSPRSLIYTNTNIYTRMNTNINTNTHTNTNMRLPPGGAQEQPALFDILRVEMFGVCPKSQNKSTPQSACFTEREFWPIWVRSIGIFYGFSCVQCLQHVYPCQSQCNATGGGREREGRVRLGELYKMNNWT